MTATLTARLFESNLGGLISKAWGLLLVVGLDLVRVSGG